jgi:hypothetical protein
MRQWWLSIAITLGGAVGLASAEYLVIVANVGQTHAGEKSTTPGMTRPSGPSNPGYPMGPRPSGPPGGFLPPGMKGPMGATGDTPPADTKEIEEKILVAFLPLEHPLSGTPLTEYKSKAVFSVPYQSKYHAHVVSLDFVTDHSDLTQIGVSLHRNKVEPKNPAGHQLETPSQKFTSKRNHLIATANLDQKNLIELLDLAISHGLNKEVPGIIEDLEKLDKNDPLVKSYHQLQEALMKPLPADPLAAQHIGLTKDRKTVDSAHFTLWYSDLKEGDIHSRLDRLEDTLRSYYYWWYLLADHHKGMPLPLPTAKLTVLLDGQEEKFRELHGQLSFRRNPAAHKGDPEQLSISQFPLVSGGYYSRPENVAVVSFKRIDPKYDLLTAHCTNVDIWNGKTPEQWLTARWDPTPAQMASKSQATSFAMMAKLMEDDAERASISHNVSRQLVIASGLLPRGVAAPEWVQFGLGSYFETPFNAPWASPTDVSSLYWPIFNELRAHRGKEKTPSHERVETKDGQTLTMVIKDGYFREIPANNADLPAQLNRARATAWSLMYFLAQKEPVKLRAYLAELSRLPRDMELTDEVLERCFYRGFGLWNEASQRPDDSAVADLERDWFKALDFRPDFEELLATVKKARETMVKAVTKAPATNPTGPRGPMPPGPNRN